jgi:hypothetical protein
VLLPPYVSSSSPPPPPSLPPPPHVTSWATSPPTYCFWISQEITWTPHIFVILKLFTFKFLAYVEFILVYSGTCSFKLIFFSDG